MAHRASASASTKGLANAGTTTKIPIEGDKVAYSRDTLFAQLLAPPAWLPVLSASLHSWLSTPAALPPAISYYSRSTLETILYTLPHRRNKTDIGSRSFASKRRSVGCTSGLAKSVLCRAVGNLRSRSDRSEPACAFFQLCSELCQHMELISSRGV